MFISYVVSARGTRLKWLLELSNLHMRKGTVRQTLQTHQVADGKAKNQNQIMIISYKFKKVMTIAPSARRVNAGKGA